MLSSTSLLKTSSEARTARWIVFCATMRTYSTPTQKITLTATCLSTGRAYVADRRAGVRNYLKKKTRSERSKSISVVIAQSAPICAYFSLVPCLAKRSMGNINQDAPIYETRRVLEPGFTFRHSADWPSWRQLSVFECFETVCGVIERSVQAHRVEVYAAIDWCCNRRFRIVSRLILSLCRRMVWALPK